MSLMVDSVMAQTYDKWELCLADDASTAPHVRPFLDRLARRDARVKVAHLPRNQGISGASNAALALATGEFIGLLDHDDVLAPSALFEVVRALNDAPATDLIYSDEDKVDDTGRSAGTRSSSPIGPPICCSPRTMSAISASTGDRWSRPSAASARV